jgi:tRNA(Ile)-lysidine synthase TilS/MesJ
MTAQSEQKEAEEIEKLAGEAEILLEEDDSKKDLKEKRGIIKQTLYDGSNKLKHIIPKGKRL